MMLWLFVLFCVAFADNECPDGWVFNHEVAECNFISTILYTADESDKLCNSIGGTSVVIRNNIDFTAYQGTRRNTTSNTFYNLDLSYFATYFWATNEPSINGDCVTLRGVHGLQVTQCYSLQPAFCRQTPSLCNSGVFGGQYTRKGTITSPGFPVQYYNNLKCTYLINSPNGTYITLDFSPFLTEPFFDLVKAYEGSEPIYQNLIGTVMDYRTSFESQANQVLITFDSNYRYTQRGWQLTWNAKKIQPTIYLNDISANFTSPNYPADYSTFDEQVYIITAPFGTQINLTIDDFRTEATHDYLDIYTELSSMKNETYAARLSGFSVAPYKFISVDTFLGLRFVSDGSLNYRGFHASYNIF